MTYLIWNNDTMSRITSQDYTDLRPHSSFEMLGYDPLFCCLIMGNFDTNKAIDLYHLASLFAQTEGIKQNAALN